MSETNPVQQLTAALTSLRVDLNKVAAQIEAKAATPAQIAELAKAIKAADPAALATSVQVAGDLAAKSLASTFDQRIADASNDLKTTAGKLAEAAQALPEAATVMRWLTWKWELIIWAVFLAMGLGLGFASGGAWAVLNFPTPYVTTAAGCSIAHGKFYAAAKGLPAICVFKNQ